jgi:hypothetical protein
MQFLSLVGDESSDLIRLLALLASEADILRVLHRQVPVILWVQKVQELCGLCADHHLSGIGLSRIHRIDYLVRRAVGHKAVPKVEIR